VDVSGRRADTSPFGPILQIEPPSRLCTQTEPNAATMKPGLGTGTSMVASPAREGGAVGGTTDGGTGEEVSVVHAVRARTVTRTSP
jgi:hypothetical protein